MRKHVFAATLIAGTAFALPASAQYTVGTTGPVVGVITEDSVPTFRRYVVEERLPSFAIPDRVVIGSTLPEVRRRLLRRAGAIWRDDLSLHDRERPDRSGRPALATDHAGDRLAFRAPQGAWNETHLGEYGYPLPVQAWMTGPRAGIAARGFSFLR